MANGGIIGPTKVVNTPQTRTETFTSSGTFQKTNCTSTIPEVMVVAGGGGASSTQPVGNSTGGGGGVGYRTATCLAMSTAAQTITVGAGGAGVAVSGPPGDGLQGNPGNDSSIGTLLISTGGGASGGSSGPLRPGSPGLNSSCCSTFTCTSASCTTTT